MGGRREMRWDEGERVACLSRRGEGLNIEAPMKQ